MVEVFKTNIQERGEAQILAKLIEWTFEGCDANFDLEDCDKILRIQTPGEFLESKELISLFNHLGFKAEILPDLI